MINAYTIGINLAVTNNVGQAVGQINAALSGLNNQVNQISRQMRSLQHIMSGHQMMRAGERILGGLGEQIKAGADLNTEFTRTLMLGGEIAKHAADMRRDSMAWAKDFPSANPASLFRTERELTPQVGYEEAKALTPRLAMLGANLAFMSGKPGGEHDALDAYKTLEAVGGLYDEKSGKFDEARFTRYTDALNATLLTSGGLTSVADMRTAARQAGPSIIGMPAEALFPFLSTLGIQMGHPRAGTASMSFAQQMSGGVMTRRTVEGMEKAKLLSHDEYTVGKGGSVVVKDEARQRLAAETADPLKFATEKLLPATQGMSNTDTMALVMGMFGRQTTQRLITDLLRNNPQFWREREVAADQQKTMGLEGAYKTMNNGSVTANMHNAEEAWKGFQQAVTDACAPEIVLGLHGLTDAVHWLAETAGKPENKQTVIYLTALTGAVGTLMTVVGGARVALGTLGMFRLGSAIGFLVRIPWLVVSVGARALATGIMAIADIAGLAALGGTLSAIGAALAVVIGAVKGFSMSPEASKEAEKRLQGLGAERRSTAPSNMVPQDMPPGFNPVTGEKINYNGAASGGRQELHVRISGSVPVMADGRVIGHVAGERMAAMLTAPPRGSLLPDPSIAPMWGAQNA